MTVNFINYSSIEPSSLQIAISPAAEEYLKEALESIQKYSILKDTIDWSDLKKKVMAKAHGAQTPSETYEAIKLALDLLGDKHSFFWDPLTAIQMNSGQSIEDAAPRVERLENHVGYILLPGSQKFGVAADAYASALQQKIREADCDQIKVWIIDLRENEGGYMWPMIAGLGPLFEDTDEPIGFFINNSNETQKWSYRQGGAYCEDTILCTVSNPYQLMNQRPKIAILIGTKTASSGEALALALSHQNSKSFGTITAGLTTGNYSHTLKDGAVLWLTESYFADRKGTAYGKEIIPDVPIDPLPNQDAALQSALEWLRF